MQRLTGLLSTVLCIGVLTALPASAQTAAEVTLTRLDCGTDATPRDIARFSDTFAYPDMKRPAFPAAAR